MLHRREPADARSAGLRHQPSPWPDHSAICHAWACHWKKISACAKIEAAAMERLPSAEDQETLRHFMREAIAEGRKALPACRPNPPVGCVLVRDGVIVARGFTQPPYQPHAEPAAL